MRTLATAVAGVTAAVALGTGVPAQASSPTAHHAVVASHAVAAGAAAGRVAPAVVVPPGRYAIGDSVMLGSKKLLTARGIRVDATVSRQFSAAVPLLASLRRANRLPRNVIVHLGTNGIVKVSDCKAIVNDAGPARRIFLVTAHGVRSWIPTANAHLRACAAAYPGRRVVVVDWDKAAAGHRSWFYADGIHPNPSGRPHYVALITSYLARYGL